MGILAIAGSLLAFLVIAVLPTLFTNTSRWPAAEGTLTDATRFGSGIRGKVRIRYTYEVGGRTYTGQRVAFWTTTVPLAVVRRSRRTGARASA